ncbi:hypothetical protein BC936DRAFT_144062 [Jimgerdemannia flammicorona]|uniref:Uncharacterized protein n=1 Tax=Jimgerdemannia flammicorona TaxID=994334 RepID=A0A433DD46_9FUNG|nr:hypothetical protein BC936DRAFT_144062 [Jimgerdemannia flammicorona]
MREGKCKKISQSNRPSQYHISDAHLPIQTTLPATIPHPPQAASAPSHQICHRLLCQLGCRAAQPDPPVLQHPVALLQLSSVGGEAELQPSLHPTAPSPASSRPPPPPPPPPPRIDVPERRTRAAGNTHRGASVEAEGTARKGAACAGPATNSGAPWSRSGMRPGTGLSACRCRGSGWCCRRSWRHRPIRNGHFCIHPVDE